MLPYHWPHPTWQQDPRGQQPHFSGAHHSQDPRWSSKPCCAAHTESITQLQRLVIHLESQVKAVLNHLADHGLSYPRLSPAAATPPLATTNKRKRESRMDSEVGGSKTSTTMKRRKLIEDLEQQVAEERADNQRMEKRIAEMRAQLAELRSKRHAITQERLNREIENSLEKGETSADDDVSDQEDEDTINDRNEEDD